MNKLLKSIALVLALFIQQFSFAQSGSNDLTFNVADIGNHRGDGPNADVMMSVQQPDGKIIICGNFPEYNGKKYRGIVRINPDGTIDETFVSTPGYTGWAFLMALQSDGKILIYGSGTTYNGTPVSNIFRINANGTLDNTFNTGNSVNGAVRSMVIQPDGKIILGGSFTTFDNGDAKRIVRLNTDGSQDITFETYGFDDEVNQLTLLPGGSILAVGKFTGYNQIYSKCSVKILPTGLIDNSFNCGNLLNASSISAASVQSDGKIIFAGIPSTGSTSFSGLRRLNSDGSDDGSFQSSGFTYSGNGGDPTISILKILPSGKLLIGGLFDTYNGEAIRNLVTVNSDGTVFQSGFNDPFPEYGSPYFVNLLSNGKILLTGPFEIYRNKSANYIALLNSDASLDESFNKQYAANSAIMAVAKQSDEKLIIGGAFTEYNDTTVKYLTRLNPDGNRDVTFNTGNGFNSAVNDIKLLPDGKIIAVGGFNNFDNFPAEKIVRLNANGSRDESFTPGSGINSAIRVVQFQSDKIIAGGNFVTFNGASHKGLVRLNSNGQLDNTFITGTGISGNVKSLFVQNDGKILVGGSFTAYNGTSRNNIIRLNEDGELDNTFTADINGEVNEIVVLADGKILAGGYFSGVNGEPRLNLVKLNADGTTDASFTSGILADGNIYAIEVMANGKLIIGGSYYNGTPNMISLYRLNTNGSLDQTFNCGTGTDETIMNVTQVADNKLIISGFFTSYDGAGRNRIARIDNGDVLGINEKAEVLASVYPNPASDEMTVNFEGACALISLTDLAGREMFSMSNFQTENKINLKNLPAGIYYLNLKTEKGSVTKTIVKS